MKKIISLSLTALMLITLLLFTASCGMESVTGYTRLRDHIRAEGGSKSYIVLDVEASELTSLGAAIATTEAGEEYVCLVGYIYNQGAPRAHQVSLSLYNGSEKAHVSYSVINAATGDTILMGDGSILLTHYTGEDFVTFDTTQGVADTAELTYRLDAQVLLNSMLRELDRYTTARIDLGLRELGFIALSEKYMAPQEETETEIDLGGPFSSARLSKAGLMIIQGMGMVFLVLITLWLVLLVFKKVFYKDPAKEKQKEETPAEVVAPVPSSQATDEDVLAAVITAAVVAYIESDPTLSSQLAGGFRVVSFKKKNGKTSWNH